MTALQFIRDGGTIPHAVSAGYTTDAIILAAQAVAKVQPFRFPQFADEAEVAAAMLALNTPKFIDEDASGTNDISTAPPKIQQRYADVLECVTEHGPISAKMVAERFGLSTDVILKTLRMLFADKEIKREKTLIDDSGRNRIYEYRHPDTAPRPFAVKPGQIKYVPAPRPATRFNQAETLKAKLIEIVAAHGPMRTAQISELAERHPGHCQKVLRVLIKRGIIAQRFLNGTNGACEYSIQVSANRPKGFAGHVAGIDT